MFEKLLLLFFSLGFLAIGIHRWQKGAYLLRHGKKANAVIYKNNRSSNGNDNMYHPVVRFLTDKQEWITQELSVGYSPKKKEGTKLEVIYDPEDPTDVEINSPFTLEILPRLFVAIGLCGLIFGLLEILDITQILEIIH